jgi:hypothetical protein
MGRDNSLRKEEDVSVRFKHCCFCEGECNNKMSSQRRVSEMQKKCVSECGEPKNAY